MPTTSANRRPRHIARAALIMISLVSSTAAARPAPRATTAADPGLAVDYTDPPPMLDLAPYAELDFEAAAAQEASSDAPPSVAVLPDGGAVVVDDQRGEAYLVGRDGSTSAPIPLDVTPEAIIATPGPVVYGLAVETAGSPMAMVAVALAGPNAGHVVASHPVVDAPTYLEPAIGLFGNTPDGVVDRARRHGAVMIEHVDTTGHPTEVGELRELLSIDADNRVVDEGNPDHEWSLRIERHPDASGPFIGALGPSDGGASVYWTTIGPPADEPDGHAAPTMPVVAVLQPDGSGTWYSVPEGWSLASTETGGTLFVRRVGGRVELARLRDAVEGEQPPGETCPPGVSDLGYPVQRCDSGEAVRAVQIGLTSVAADLAVDGHFGPLTERAVRVFQQQHGLVADGLVGAETWPLLTEGIAVGEDSDGSGVIDPWETRDVVDRRYSWAVVLAVSADFDDPELHRVADAAREAGFEASPNGCDFGAPEALGGAAGSVTVSVHFETEDEADVARVELAEHGLAGVVAQIYTTCLD